MSQPVTPPVVQLACHSMNTRFELVLWGKPEPYLTAVAEEAVREIQALNQQLSYYRDDSDIRELNVVAARRPVTVEPRLFRLLSEAKRLSEATEGAFDITVAPLLRAWGFTGAGGRVPSDEEIAEAKALTGMHLVELDPEGFTVRFLREGVQIDLGAIGKGYAIERVAALIREYEVPGALVHGGTSSVAGIGTQPDGSPWQIALQDPLRPEALLASLDVSDRALSVSAPHGKWFTGEGERYGHVLDPRSGRPVQGALLAAVTCNSATAADALSTAVLTLGEAFLPQLPLLQPDAEALVAVRDGEGLRVETTG